MGIIWTARSNQTKRLVVVKEPLLNNDKDQVKIERLLAEADVLRGISDERSEPSSDVELLLRAHVVGYVDQSTSPQLPLLVLQHINGPSMSTAFTGRPLSEGAASHHILTLLRVVEALHSRNVIHRDLSPSNIVMNPARGLILIDFGTAFRHAVLNPTGSTRGRVIFKRGYSAPELLQGQSDEKSDVFSIGATMFFLLTGRSPDDFMIGPKNPLVKAPNRVNPKVSDGVSEIIEKAMSPDPEKRFQTTTQMLRVLESQLAEPQTSVPVITFAGTVYELRGKTVDIGRSHSCGKECKPRDSVGQIIQVQVFDPQKYIERHHARIWLQDDGTCFIEDMHSANRTAIKHQSSSEFRLLSPFRKEKLENGDTVALAYSPSRGPYVTFRFNVK